MDLTDSGEVGGAVTASWAVIDVSPTSTEMDVTDTANGAGPSQLGGWCSDVSLAVRNDPTPGSASATKFVLNKRPSTKPPPNGKGKANSAPTKATGKAPARSQKPAAKRDERNEAQLIAHVKSGLGFDARVVANRPSEELKSPSIESLLPQELDSEEHSREAARGLSPEKEAKVKRLALELKERTVDLPLIEQKMYRWGTEVEEEGSDAHMQLAGLSDNEKRIYTTYSAFEQVDALQIGVDDGDLLDRGLSTKQQEQTTEPPMVLPSVCHQDNFNVGNKRCAYKCNGCHGAARHVPTMGQIWAVECMQTDKEKADDCIVALIKSLDIMSGSNYFSAMHDRVAGSVSCNNANCKIAAGIITIPERVKHNASPHQDANQVNGNRRYHSDKHFDDSIVLARRLFLEHKDFGEAEARRLVKDTTQFAYWIESRECDAIGTCYAFVEDCVTLGLPWCHQARQEFLDRASSVPRNHVMCTIADHVVSPKRGQSFGVTGERCWYEYFKHCLCKFMYPEPLTGIALFVRVKNWDANGRPVKVDNQGKVTLVDFVDSNHPGIALMGTAADFHTAVKPYMDWRTKNKAYVPSSASEGALGQGTETASYGKTFSAITKTSGRSGAIERAMMAKYMHANGTDTTTHMPTMSKVRTNGTDEATHYAPACATLFCNNNVTTLWRNIYWAIAYGLDADFKFGHNGTTRVALENFSKKHLQTLFLERCRDKTEGVGAWGHKVVPSEVVDSLLLQQVLQQQQQQQQLAVATAGAGAGAGAAVVVPLAVGGKREREQYRATSQPLGGNKMNKLMLWSIHTPVAGVPSGMGLSSPWDRIMHGKNAQVRTVPYCDSFCERAPMDEALRHARANYDRLLAEEVIDKETTTFATYATLDVPHQIMQWQIARERRKKIWYHWFKETSPTKFAELVAKNLLKAEWSPGMSEDPEGTANGQIKTHSDYIAAVDKCKQTAKDLVILLKNLPGGLPQEPKHFGYWCSVQRIDPDTLWPTDKELRKQYARKQLLGRESELLQLLEGVKVALEKEKGTSLRRLNAGATQEEKTATLAKVREESDLWKQRKDALDVRSMNTDHVFKPRLARWLNGTTSDDDSAEEKAHMARIEQLYVQDLELRFDGGAAQELERRRAALTNHGYNSLYDEAARAKAELLILRQDMTTQEVAAEENRCATAAAGVMAAEQRNDVELVVALRSEDMRLATANSTRCHADVQPPPPKETGTTVHEGALDFPATVDYSTAFNANTDADTYLNPRLNGRSWCNAQGRAPAALPPSKRAKL